MYKCSGCGLAVIVIGENKIKACKCDAPIIAAMSVKLIGEGKQK